MAAAIETTTATTTLPATTSDYYAFQRMLRDLVPVRKSAVTRWLPVGDNSEDITYELVETFTDAEAAIDAVKAMTDDVVSGQLIEAEALTMGGSGPDSLLLIRGRD